MTARCTNVLAAISVFATVGCNRDATWLRCVPKTQNPRIQVLYTQARDPLQGDVQAVRYGLRLVNSTDRDLNDVRLTINDAWSAHLGQLEQYRGFREGTDVVRHDRLKAGESIELLFSHDVSNHRHFTNSVGQRLPVSTRFATLRVDYDGTVEEFAFSDGDRNPTGPNQ